MKNKCAWWGVMTLVASTCLGQTAVAPRVNVHRYGGGYGNNYWSGGGGGTAAGSYATGMSNVIRAQGQYNMMTAEAAISAQQARTLDIQNRKQATETYFEMRKINEANRLAEYDKNRPTSEELARFATKPKPPRLKASQYDPVSGQINWPVVLSGDEYASYRDGLQMIYSRLAQGSPSAYGQSLATIQQYTTAMRAELDKHISQMTGQDWINGKNFIDGLAYEAMQATN